MSENANALDDLKTSVRLHIGNIPLDITENDIMKKFSVVKGVKITECEIPISSIGVMKGFAFITLEGFKSAIPRLMKIFNNSLWNGKMIKVSKAQAKYDIRHLEKQKEKGMEEPIKPVIVKVEMPIYDNEPLLIRKKKGNGVMKLTPQTPVTEFTEVKPLDLSQLTWEELEKPKVKIVAPKIKIIPVPDFIKEKIKQREDSKKKKSKRSSKVSDKVISFLNPEEEIDQLFTQYNSDDSDDEISFPHTVLPTQEKDSDNDDEISFPKTIIPSEEKKKELEEEESLDEDEENNEENREDNSSEEDEDKKEILEEESIDESENESDDNNDEISFPKTTIPFEEKKELEEEDSLDEESNESDDNDDEISFPKTTIPSDEKKELEDEDKKEILEEESIDESENEESNDSDSDSDKIVSKNEALEEEKSLDENEDEDNDNKEESDKTIQKIDKNKENKPKLSKEEKKRLANEKRLKAIEEAQKRLEMNNRLLPETNMKITPSKNKRVVFDDSDDDSNENDSSNNNNNTLLEFIDYKKNTLFDSDSNNDNSDDDNESNNLDESDDNSDDDDDDQKRFEIKKQFEGKKGRKLFEMQKRIENGDDRFKIDERFMDSDNESEKEENENDENIENEQERAMNILTEMFGTTVKQKSEIITDDYQGIQRYDPTLTKEENEENESNEENNENNSKDDKKKDKKQSENNYDTEKGRYIETAGSLSSLFASSDNKPFTFFKNEEEEETKDNELSTSTIIENNKKSSADLPWYSIKKTTSLVDNPLYFKDSEDNNKEDNVKINEGVIVPEIENSFMRIETDEEIKADWLKWRDKYTTHFKLQMKRKRNDIPTGGKSNKKGKFNK